MQGHVVAEKLAFPEGPVWHEGYLYFVEIASGAVSRFRPGQGVERFALPGGGPNGATLGPRSALYLTQNGGMSRSQRVTAGIVRVARDIQNDQDGRGDQDAQHAQNAQNAQDAHDTKVELLTSEVAGLTLDGPNDLAFGPDGRLYFTDPRGAADPSRNSNPGRIFAWDLRDGSGELLLQLEPVFPNGIGFDRDGTLLWTESFSRRVMALRAGKPEVVVQLPDRHFPDGFCVGADGRLYVASTFGHCVTVIEGTNIVDRYECGNGMPTNCCFVDNSLYVTESRHGTLWRFDVGRPGLPLHTGRQGV